MLGALDPSARVLEVGSGARFLDERVVSLEMVAEPGVDVAASVERLPFRDGAFDFVFSQAVLEHVQHPHVAVAEMQRVLRPGGLFYAEVAFIQPVHMAPHHYFNHSRYGLELVCDGLVDVEVGPIGSFAEVVRWLCVKAGAVEVLGSKWLDRLLADLGTLEDRQSWDQQMNTASGVWLRGVKP
jgi:ubiquinone/menaquinone biosynthesis C-methylase UbiE